MYASPASRTSSWKRLMTCAVCRTVIALCHAECRRVSVGCARNAWQGVRTPHVHHCSTTCAAAGTTCCHSRDCAVEEGPTGLLHGCDAALADAIGRI